MKKELNNTTKADVIEMLDAMRGGNYTAAYVTDCQGYNGSYNCVSVDDFFDDEEGCRFDGVDWSLMDFYIANPENVDMNQWAQDFEEIGKDGLRMSMEEGELYIAEFEHDKEGSIHIMIWI